MSQLGSSHAQAFAPRLERHDGRINIIGMSREELEQAFKALNLPSFRVKQVWQWVYG